MAVFALDGRLHSDTIAVADLGLSTLRLMNDRRYPWVVLVPRRAGLVELFDLSTTERRALIDEIAIVSEALSNLSAAHKINVATLGNVVRQLHVHVVARHEGDEAWPRPVWGRGEMSPYEEGAGARFAARLAAMVEGSPTPSSSGPGSTRSQR